MTLSCLVITKQLNVIKRFLHEATEVVHAGDPDREGQLLVDEVLDYLELAPEKRQQVQREALNDVELFGDGRTRLETPFFRHNR